MLSEERIEEIANEVAAPVSRYLPYWRTSVDFARAIEAAVLPEGWVLVPRIVTPAIEAVYSNDSGAYGTAQELHNAMLAAAPKPAQAEPRNHYLDILSSHPSRKVTTGECESCKNFNYIKCQCENASCVFEPVTQAEKQEPVNDEPVARVDANDDGYWADILPDRSVKVGQLLYTRPQPDLTAEVERLRQICRDAYEVWAGSNGIPEPITCVEAYLLQLLIAMRDEVKRGLK
jgi:hypothetical protein